MQTLAPQEEGACVETEMSGQQHLPICRTCNLNPPDLTPRWSQRDWRFLFCASDFRRSEVAGRVAQLLVVRPHRIFMTTPAPESSTPKKSKLVPIGILFIVVGLLGRQPLAGAVASMQPSSLRSILYIIATDGLTLLFVAGVTCALLGWLRNRKARRDSED